MIPTITPETEFLLNHFYTWVEDYVGKWADEATVARIAENIIRDPDNYGDIPWSTVYYAERDR